MADNAVKLSGHDSVSIPADRFQQQITFAFGFYWVYCDFLDMYHFIIIIITARR